MFGTVISCVAYSLAVALQLTPASSNMPIDTWTAPRLQHDYLCAEAPELATADTDSDGILTVEEMRRLAAMVPDSRDLEANIEDMVDRGYAGIQYDGNCVNTQPQTDIDTRLIALEARVADLEARIERLEALLDVEALPTQAAQGEETPDRDETPTGITTVSGTGSTVTDDFRLEAGRYEVALTLQSGCCISIFLHGPDSDGDLLFNEIFDFDSEGGQATIIYEIPASGTYFIDSQNTNGSWTITFRKR